MTDYIFVLFSQLPLGPGVSDLQCFVHYRAICRLCHRNPLLDGKYFDCHKAKSRYSAECFIIVLFYCVGSIFTVSYKIVLFFHALQ